MTAGPGPTVGLAATTDPRRRCRSYDAIVIGAGPAGSVTAFRLAREGVSVLLVDKARFPRDKPCGGGLTLRAVRQLPLSVDPVVEHVVTSVEFGVRYRHRYVRRRVAATDPDDPAPAAGRVPRRAGGGCGGGLPGRSQGRSRRARGRARWRSTLGGDRVTAGGSHRRRRGERRRRRDSSVSVPSPRTASRSRAISRTP